MVDPAQNARGAHPWNVANVLTMVRIVLVPVFAYLLVTSATAGPGTRLAAMAVFAVAAASDQLDGYLARRLDLVTNLGKILDPIADKLLMGTALVILSVLGDLPWWVTVVILVREVGITLWRLGSLRVAVVPAGWGGKVKTVVQAVAIGLYLLPLEEWGGAIRTVSMVVMGVAVLLTVTTGVSYLRHGLAAYRPGPEGQAVVSHALALDDDDEARAARVRRPAATQTPAGEVTP